MKIFEQFCKDIFSKNQNMKHMMFAGDFNMNVLDYEYNGKVKSFFDLVYQCNLIPAINKPTRVGKNSATAIDHIITDYVLTCDFKTAILKTDLADHFPIVIALKNDGPFHQHSKTTKHKHKRSYNEESFQSISKLSITDYFQSVGMKLKTAMIPMRLTNSFLIYLTQFMIYISRRFSLD